MTKFNKAEYKLSIYYKGVPHPMTVERNSVEDLDKWLSGKRNHIWLKNCDKWVIQNTEGYEIKSGKAITEEVIKIVVDE